MHIESESVAIEFVSEVKPIVFKPVDADEHVLSRRTDAFRILNANFIGVKPINAF